MNLPTIFGGSCEWRERIGISENGDSDIEDRDSVQNRYEAVNGPEGRSRNEISGESGITEAAIPNLGGVGMWRYHLIWKCRFQR